MGITPHGVAADPATLLPSAAFLLVLLVLVGCGRDPAPGGQNDQGAAETVGDTLGMGDGGLPISASISADSAAAAAAEVPAGSTADTASADAREASRVVEDYYAAIAAGDYERAFGYWGDSGRASGQSYLEFVAGFAQTAGVTVSVGEAGRVEGAAGSRYIQIPVVVTATAKGGGQQRFEGGYTLRRSVVDGATPEQRRWHLHDAKLRELR